MSEATKERMLEGKGEKRRRNGGITKRRRRNEARVAATGAPSVTVGAPAPAHSWRALPRCDLWKQRRGWRGIHGPASFPGVEFRILEDGGGIRFEGFGRIFEKCQRSFIKNKDRNNNFR